MYNNFDRMTVQGLSAEEFNELRAILDRETEKLVNNSATRGHLEVGVVAISVLSFLWQNRKEIVENAKLAQELIEWVQKLVKRRSSQPDKDQTPQPGLIIELVRPDDLSLDLLHATPEDVRKYFRTHPNCL